MINMEKKWFEKIINSILELKTNIVFVIDPDNILSIPEIRDILQEHNKNITEFKNEINLRILLKQIEKNTIVTFKNKQEIPYDLLSTQATINIDIGEIFSLLDKTELLQLPFENYQILFEKHETLKEENYDRLSKEKTQKFIKEIPAKYISTDTKRILELKTDLTKISKDFISDSNTWGEIGRKFGELMYHLHKNEIEINKEILEAESILNYKFMAYILKYYEDLLYHSNPLINSNLLKIIFEDSQQKNAIICFDCMGYEEWYAIKNYLEQLQSFQFIEKHSFSMLPSETNYSSSALFAGMTPKEIKNQSFINSINWRNEEKLFRNALKKKDIDDSQIFFQRCIEPKDINIPDIESFSDYHSIGIIFSFIDRFIHTDFLNDKNLVIQNIEKYLQKTKISNFILSLLNQDFKVFITSDHGNILSSGNNIQVKRDLVDSKAKRYLIQERRELLEEYKVEKESVIMQLKNMNGDEYLLLQTGNKMFGRKNEKELTHGGISLSEVIIPFIEVKKA
ncbi:PglZ domain-containing protein [Thermoplasmatales archaeon SCGC AB-539-N05]|nr:PglZ domain-containing protein [Thermoplasmatales archaeon SCGC AB-539-N05]